MQKSYDECNDKTQADEKYHDHIVSMLFDLLANGLPYKPHGEDSQNPSLASMTAVAHFFIHHRHGIAKYLFISAKF
jgi:hypothetical protein